MGFGTKESTMQKYLVGGAVRDMVLGRPCKDFDYLYIGNFDDVVEEAIKEGFTIYLEKPEHKTIRCSHPVHGAVDIQADHDLKWNLYSRDFTINAWAYEEKTKTFISSSGKRIVTDKPESLRPLFSELKVVHGSSLNHDPVRVIRGIRFLIELNLKNDLQTYFDLADASVYDWFPKDDNSERVRAELQKLFKLDTARVLKELAQYPVLLSSIMYNIQLNPTVRKHI